MPTNTAAWLMAKQTKLEVKPAPYVNPREGEIVIKNHAVAINTIDWVIQVAGNIVFSWIKYPFILGADLSGEVVEVGKGVAHFKVGDRVLGHAVGTDKKRNRSAEGAFQEYTVILAQLAAPIPSTMPYDKCRCSAPGLVYGSLRPVSERSSSAAIPPLQIQNLQVKLFLFGEDLRV